MLESAAKPAFKIKTGPYDIAKQLRTPEEMATYLDAWLEEAPDDAAGIARAKGILLDVSRNERCATTTRERSKGLN